MIENICVHNIRFIALVLAANPRAAGEEVQDKLQVESLRKTIFLVSGLMRFSRAVAEKLRFIGYENNVAPPGGEEGEALKVLQN